MTRDEIYELAFQCRVWIPLATGPEREETIDKLRRFAAVVAAAEREVTHDRRFVVQTTPRRQEHRQGVS